MKILTSYRERRTAALGIVRFCATMAGFMLAFPVVAAEQSYSGALPPDVVRLLEAASLASASVAPDGSHLLLIHRRGLMERGQLGATEVSIAGRRIDPEARRPSVPLNYQGFSVVDLMDGDRREIALPSHKSVGYPRWAPDGSRFAYTLATDQANELWVADPREGDARRLAGNLNAVFAQPCVWLSDNRTLLCRRVEAAAFSARGSEPEPWLQPVRSGIQFAALRSDRINVEGLLESRLWSIDVVSGEERAIGAPAAITSVDPAPGADFLLITRVVEPYPQVDGIDDMQTRTEIWNRTGRIVKTLSETQRAVRWRSDRPATLSWVEQHEGHDRLVMQAAPFDEAADTVVAMAHRFAGMTWLGNGEVLVREYIPERRVTRRWLVFMDTGASPHLLDRRDVDTGTGGILVTTRDRRGRTVARVHNRHILLRGVDVTEAGQGAPYIDRINLDNGARTRQWTGGGDGYERIEAVISDDARTLLTRHETSDMPPNYFLVNRATGARVQLTHHTDPAPALRDIRTTPLSYIRDDGVELSATLYTPEAASRPLPLVIWAYPKQVGEQPALPESAPVDRYLGTARGLKLFFLLCGYAVMDDVAMPIVDKGGSGNDSFVEQVVANARTAINAAARTGLVDPDRIAVAGHSYGAFMVGNLLAHSNLFRAGAALSGAYNRTLTPFGFQTERRTLWEAPELYLTMSPLMYSDRIDTPLLLVHGTADTNAGTSPLQSLQFYRAIRGNGGEAELLLLPREGHVYRTRESVLETASAMLLWFDRHLKVSASSAAAGPGGVTIEKYPGTLPGYDRSVSANNDTYH